MWIGLDLHQTANAAALITIRTIKNRNYRISKVSILEFFNIIFSYTINNFFTYYYLHWNRDMK